jgi:hypothetical protein
MFIQLKRSIEDMKIYEEKAMRFFPMLMEFFCYACWNMLS